MRIKNKNLLNGDCNAYFYNPELWQPEGGPYSAKAIHRLIKKLADNGIDTFLINPNGQQAYYPSKKFPWIHANYKRGDREFFRTHAKCEKIAEDKVDSFIDYLMNIMDLYLDLYDAGVDWLAETTVACHAYGVAPWVSIRMNDTHGAPFPESFMNCELFRNPEYRLNRYPINPKDNDVLRREGLNYEKKEVRDYMFSLIQEVIEDYNFEGIELDWLRDPICCRPVASDETVEQITNWIMEIKKLTIKKSKQIGKPYPLGVRVPGHLDYLRDIGLDVEKMANEGVIDFVGTSNFYQTSWDMPFDSIRQRLGKDTAIFGVIEGAPNWMKCSASTVDKTGTFIDRSLGYRSMQYNKEMIRGNAAGKLVFDIDGIEMFNNFFGHDRSLKGIEAAYDVLKETSDLELLRGKEKQYTFSSQFWSPYTTLAIEMTESFPTSIEPDCRRTFRLPMCSEPDNSELQLIVQIIVNKKENMPDIGVSFNNCWPSFNVQSTDMLLFSSGKSTHIWEEYSAFNFNFSISKIREGWNEITVYNGSHETNSIEDRNNNSIRLVGIELAVKKQK